MNKNKGTLGFTIGLVCVLLIGIAVGSVSTQRANAAASAVGGSDPSTHEGLTYLPVTIKFKILRIYSIVNSVKFVF